MHLVVSVLALVDVAPGERVLAVAVKHVVGEVALVALSVGIAVPPLALEVVVVEIALTQSRSPYM